MKIEENRRKGGEKSQVACEEKNEENRGLIDKKAYENQLAGLVSVILVSSVLELSPYSLSLSHSSTFRLFLEHSSFGARKEKQAKGKEGKQGASKEDKDQATSTGILAGSILHV